MDFEEAAKRLEVKPEVLEALFNEMPFEDSFNLIVSSESQEVFWDYVDSLPRRIAMKMHEIELQISVTANEFPEETMSPILESFWAANLLSKNMVPETVNSQAVTQIYPELVEEFLGSQNGWEKSDVEHWQFGDYVFSLKTLVEMCNCFISNGRSWLFFDLPELRSAYSVFGKEIEKLDNKFGYVKSRIMKKLKSFGYQNTAEMIADANGFDHGEIPEFEISEDLCKSMVDLMNMSKNVFKMPGKPPEIGPINEWVATRSEALVQQMQLPLQQRSAFILTPQVLQARSGMNPEVGFEPLSLAELLFSNSNGESCPMPFANAKIELPASSPISYCRAVFRRFVARRLLGEGYTIATDPALDVLSDVVANEVRRISQTAVIIKESTGQSDVLCMEHALKNCRYEVLSLPGEGNL